MAANTVGGLLHALAQAEIWQSLAGTSVPAIRKFRDWHQRVFSVDGVEDLVILCRSEGKVFGYDWLAQQHAKIIEESGVSRKTADKITVVKLAGQIREMRTSQAIAAKQRSVATVAASTNYGRRPSKSVAKRREFVDEHRDELGPGEIAAKLFNLRAKGKLPRELPVGVENVKSDIKFLRNGK